MHGHLSRPKWKPDYREKELSVAHAGGYAVCNEKHHVNGLPFWVSSFCSLMLSKCSTLSINVFYREERHFWSILFLALSEKSNNTHGEQCSDSAPPSPKAEDMQLFGMSPTATTKYHRNWALKETQVPSTLVLYVRIRSCGLLVTREAQCKERTGWTRCVTHRRPSTQHAQSSVRFWQWRLASMYKHKHTHK